MCLHGATQHILYVYMAQYNTCYMSTWRITAHIMCIHSAIQHTLYVYMARAHIRVYRAHIVVYRVHIGVYRAHIRVYRALCVYMARADF